MAGFKLELTFDDDGNLEKVKEKGATTKEDKDWKKHEMPLELKALIKVIPLNLAYIHNSPGQWCLIGNQWHWCP